MAVDIHGAGSVLLARPPPPPSADYKPNTESIGRASEVTGRTGRYANPAPHLDQLIQYLMDPTGHEVRARGPDRTTEVVTVRLRL